MQWNYPSSYCHASNHWTSLEALSYESNFCCYNNFLWATFLQHRITFIWLLYKLRNDLYAMYCSTDLWWPGQYRLGRRKEAIHLSDRSGEHRELGRRSERSQGLGESSVMNKFHWKLMERKQEQPKYGACLLTVAKHQEYCTQTQRCTGTQLWQHQSTESRNTYTVYVQVMFRVNVIYSHAFTLITQLKKTLIPL